MRTGGFIMFIFLLVVLASHGGLASTVFGKNDADTMFYRMQKAFEKSSANLTEEMLIIKHEPKVGYKNFVCPASVSPKVPESVHQVRPGDIRVVAALGDSLTNAYAAGASIFTPIMFEYPGMAANAGGDKSLEEIITLPNILRKYNPHLHGFSTGLAFLYTQPSNKNLNFAMSGAYAEDMPHEARELINRMKNDHAVDFDNDWKFVSLFVGGNDLCSGCISPSESSPEQFIKYFDQTIQILHDESPRTFVNVLSVPLANQLALCRGPVICDLMTTALCPCLLGGAIPEQYMYLKSREFQRLIRTSVESGKFDDKDDFAAVYQPFLEDTTIPLLPDGSIDRSYFAPDCFHLSQKGQASQAVANWNNLFQPVGSKINHYIPSESIDCPSTDFPYLYTNVNSKPEFIRKFSKSNHQAPPTNGNATLTRKPNAHGLLRMIP